MNQNPTIDQLRKLIAACDDGAGNHVLWIKKNGEVVLSRISCELPAFEQSRPDMQLRLETFLAGNEYVGAEAANDDEWMAELLERLSCEWNAAKGKPDVAHVDVTL